MFLVSLTAATLAGAFAAGAAYCLGSGIFGIVVTYAIAGNITFAAIIAMLTSGTHTSDIDFQQQAELDLLAMKLDLMRQNESGKRVSLFRQERQGHKRRSRVIPRPIRSVN